MKENTGRDGKAEWEPGLGWPDLTRAVMVHVEFDQKEPKSKGGQEEDRSLNTGPKERASVTIEDLKGRSGLARRGGRMSTGWWAAAGCPHQQVGPGKQENGPAFSVRKLIWLHFGENSR